MALALCRPSPSDLNLSCYRYYVNTPRHYGHAQQPRNYRGSHMCVASATPSSELSSPSDSSSIPAGGAGRIIVRTHPQPDLDSRVETSNMHFARRRFLFVASAAAASCTRLAPRCPQSTQILQHDSPSPELECCNPTSCRILWLAA